MTSLFISYSRRDIEFARNLTKTFKDQGLDFWIDWEGIPPTVDWWMEIEKGIEEADIFIFLISPDSVKSNVCSKETLHAIKNGKRLIPIVVRDVTQEEVPSELSHLNWIFLRATDDYNVNYGKLISAIKTDFEWVKTHRQLQVKALEWERSGFEKSFLLRGKELQDAESQLAVNTSKEPHPTDLQRKYVHESRQASDRQKRITATISLVGLVSLAALAIFGFTQAALATRNAEEAQAASTLASKNEAIAKANEITSRAGELAAKSAALRENNFPVSLLLSIESYELKDIPQSRGALLDSAYANPQLLRYILPHNSLVTSVAFNSDGTILASAGEDGTITILDTNQYRVIGQLNGHSDKVNQVAFRPGTNILASASKDQSIILWDATSYQPISAPLIGHNGNVTSIAFSPDGLTLASGSTDQSVILWDVQNQSPIDPPLRRNDAGVTSIAFSSDGRTLASASDNGRIVLWDIQTLSSSIYETGSQIYSIAFKPNSNLLAIATCGKFAADGFCSLGKIILLDSTSLQLLGKPIIGHANHINHVTFSPDGNILASGGWDKTIILWNTVEYQPLAKPLYGHTSNVNSISFSPNGNYFVSGGGDKSIILWDEKPHQPIGRQFGLGHETASLAVTKDGDHFATGSDHGVVYLWDARNDPPTSQSLVGHDSTFVNALAFAPNGNILASGSHDTTVRLWDVESGQPIGNPLIGHTELITTLAFSPNGNIIASGSWDDTIILWDVSNPGAPSIRGTLPRASERVISLAFSPDGKILASGYQGDELPDDLHANTFIVLWNVETMQPIGTPLTDHTDSVNSLVFSPNGKYLFSGSWDKTIIQWDVASRQPISRFNGHIDLIYSIAISSDGTLLASGGSDKTIILWDVATHQPLGQPFSMHTNQVISTAFVKNDKELVTGSWDDTIIFWSLEPDVWKGKICERVGRNFSRAEWAQYFPKEEYRSTCEQWLLEP